MIDRNLIEEYAFSVHTHEILGPSCIPEARVKGCDYSFGSFPFIDEPIEHRAKFWTDLGAVRNPDEFYPFYFAIACIMKPRVIAEIGTWWGYALMAMATGALVGCVPKRELSIYGFDIENYPGAENCLAWIQQTHDSIGIRCKTVHCDSREFDGPGLPIPIDEPVDMFSVDGDHTYQSAYKDLVLAERCCAPGATIVVDDVGWALNVRDAVEDFAEKYRWDTLWLPTLKGSAVLQRRA